MNFVGHLAVATAHERWDDPGFRLGVVAPDLAGSAGFTVEAGSEAVAVGLAEHHRADAAFHALVWFQATARELSSDLQAAGVRRGPSRAVGHVGCELLLDGELLHDQDVATGLDETWALLRAHRAEVAGLVVEAQRGAWRTWLDRFTAALDPYRYAEPAVVATITERLLARRARLAFSEAERPAVLATLEAHAGGIRTGARDAVAAVQGAVGDAGTTSRRP